MLRSILKIVESTGPRLFLEGMQQHQKEKLVDSLLVIAKAKWVASDICTHAATVISIVVEYLLPLSTGNFLRCITGKIEENASILISILSTSSIMNFPSKDNNSDDETIRNSENPMGSLYKLASISVIFRKKMVKRRCTILALVRYLNCSNHRQSTLEFCKTIFLGGEGALLIGEAQQNLDIIVQGMMKLIYEDAVAEQHQIVAISILCQILDMSFDLQSNSLTETLKWVAFNENISEDAVIRAAKGYCNFVKNQQQPNIQQLKTVVAFVALPQNEVRKEALGLIELQRNGPCILGLLDDSNLLSQLVHLISTGSTQECNVAFDIVRQIARSSCCHKQLCQHPDLLKILIHFIVSSKEDSNLLSPIETLLSLLLNEDNTMAFLPFPDLLPWLLKFAKIASKDDNFEQQILSAIVRLWLASLKD